MRTEGLIVDPMLMICDAAGISELLSLDLLLASRTRFAAV